MKAHNAPHLVLGIDTGGTYTDAVLLDYASRTVRASTKALTTHHDLALGIVAAIDALISDNAGDIDLVCVSTTLATNSVVEGRRGRVGLALLGYDSELMSRYRLQERLATTEYRLFTGGHDVNGDPQCPPDLDGLSRWAESMNGRIDAFAVSGYFSPLNPEHEEMALARLREASGLPVILGHQLTNRLDSIQRATTAVLNASLLPVISRFVSAVIAALKRHSITAPLMVVKGTGTLMSSEAALRLPVETVSSGPAASALGGKFLSGVEDGLVIDIGGTTTDIVLIQNGLVDLAEEGAEVGGYRTAVQAAGIRSIGLGGDSRIWFDRDGSRHIGPQRVQPISHLAAEYPEVAQQMATLLQKSILDVRTTDLEYWYSLSAQGEIPGDVSPVQRKVLDHCAEEPVPVTNILKALGVVHPLQLGADTLLQRGLLGRAGLTPTDLLHVAGEYVQWDANAASAVMNLTCRIMEKDTHSFISDTFRQMRDIICEAVVSFLAAMDDRSLPGGIRDGYGSWFLRNSFDGGSRFLETKIKLGLPVIGIGAPAGAFLTDVAAALHTELVLPDHYEVANAAGTVAGGVVARHEALVYAHQAEHGADAYYVQAGDERLRFQHLDAAIAEARRLVAEAASNEAIANGAVHPESKIEVEPQGFDGFRVTALAAGNPRLS